MTILISGACGFMGREVAAQAKSSGIDVVCGVDIAAGVAPYQPDFPLYANYADAPKADVVIDFSNWKPGANVLDYATKHRVPVVIASTGLTDEQLHQIAEASKVVPIFRSGNMSLGIALLRALAKKAASVLGDAFDVEIVEAHHNRKLDAPSGTALMLLDAVKSAYPDEREAVSAATDATASASIRKSGCTPCAAARSRASMKSASSARARESASAIARRTAACLLRALCVRRRS